MSTFSQYPFSATLRVLLAMLPATAGAQQLNVDDGATHAASGVFATPTNKTAALQASGRGSRIRADHVAASTRGAEAYAAIARNGGTIELFDADLHTQGFKAHGVSVVGEGFVQLTDSLITTESASGDGVGVYARGTDVGHGRAALRNVQITSRGDGLLAEGPSSRIEASHVGISSAAAPPDQTVLAAHARQGGTILLSDSDLRNDADAPTVRAGGSTSVVELRQSQVVAVRAGGSGVEATSGGLARLYDGSVDAGKNGLSAVGEGSSIRAEGTRIVSREGLGVAVERAASVELGEGTRISAAHEGIRVQGEGSRVRASGIGIISATTGINAFDAAGLDMADSHIDAQGHGINAASGSGVRVRQSQVNGGSAGIAFVDDTRQATREGLAVVDIEGGSVAAQKGPAVLVQGSDRAEVRGQLLLRHGTRLSGVDGRLVEVVAAGRTAALQVIADNVALAGDLRADPGTVLDLALRNSARLDGAISGGGEVIADAGSRWDLTRDSDLASLRNAGTVEFTDPAQGGFKTLTVHGDYTGADGVLALNTVLAGDDAQTDRLVVEGDTRGRTALVVRNAGGVGAPTTEGIRVVQVEGQSQGVFALQGRAVAGAYEYRLYQGGVADALDGDWYLRSQADTSGQPTTTTTGGGQALAELPPPRPVYRPETGAYLGNQAAGLAMFQHQMHDRMGEPDFAGRQDGRAPAAWARVQRRQIDGKAGGGQLDLATNASLLQAGGELAAWTVGGQRFHVGAMGGFGRADSKVGSRQSGYRANGEVEGYGVGLYGIWFASAEQQAGPYADAWLQYGDYNNRVRGAGLAEERYDAESWAASLEGGWTFALPSGEKTRVFVEPQAQLIYTDYRAGDHVEANGTRVDASRSDAVTTRVGVRVFGHAAASGHNLVQPFLMLNWWHDDREGAVSFDGDRVVSALPRDRYEAKVGAQAQLGGGWTGWANAAWATGRGDYRDVGGQLGVNYRW
ncbi:MAG TPA: autotransporter outer membrane beta-barrel domain-containing protein [Stenotrophomonas sp.]|jgi:autotransporter family porin